MSDPEPGTSPAYSAPRLLGFFAGTLMLLFAAGCWNPFAPGLGEGDGADGLLGDPSTIEGFFTRFQNAYQLRDTTLYGPLIARDFVFTFRDYDNNVDISWGRNEEMNSTYRLFINSQDIRIRWNNILSQDINAERTRSQVIRRFDLTVALEASDLIRTDGAVNFVLERPDSTENWQLRSWRDESDL
ncbi:MAG: hypothetical protein LAT75_05465 [Candidatus Cyclonatronum sp.]|uniref:hypothetical protein n=1 Tax=Cyclonatronum sp. TaxID=3024185 RepID=UPI0025BBAEDB|nr:hypothetical protein [Cyclonatronum sp.]MCC5933909.1 hypothetical protein [Balneolales bacterium]MCH8486293.1 hypothetical protein [Cyclonatronum sp.]